MSTTTYSSNTSRDHHSTDGSAREIQQEIQRTRHEMDETIDKLGQRLDPRNLVDYFVDMFRGGGDGSNQHLTESLKSASQSAGKIVRNHPGPALLIGAGALWWIAEQSMSSDDDDSGRPLRRSGREDVMSTPAYPVQTWRQEVPAWHERFDWSRAEGESQEEWNRRAEQTLRDLQAASKQQENAPAGHRIRHTASKLVGLSGHKRAEIHARWANLREHSGSFVDARTGEPYDENYGKEWRHLMSADVVAGDYESDEDHRWRDKASQTWESIQSALNDAQSSTRDRIRRISEAVSHYANETGRSTKSFGSSMASTASDWAHNVGDSFRAAGHYTSDAAHHAASGIAAGASGAQRQLARGARSAQSGLDQALREYPLAVGAACLGLGLLAGMMIPHSRYEDQWMGEASDEFKEDVVNRGKEAVESGKRVASQTAAAAMDEAEKQGLTPHQLGESAREAVGAVKQSVSKAVEKVSNEPAHLAAGASQVASRAAETAKQETEKEVQQHRHHPR